MSQDVRQWLGEIKHLQQQLDVAHQEREEAYASAANWRNLYETEAKQRRTDIAIAQGVIEELQDALAQQQPALSLPAITEEVPEAIQQQVDGVQTMEELRQLLQQALVACDRLTKTLEAEQLRHAQTRQELTAALGDTIDQLTRERSGRAASSQAQTPPPAVTVAPVESPSIRTPSLELPPLDQAQSRL